MFKDKLLSFITVGLFFTGLACIGYVLFSNFFLKKAFDEIGITKCVTATLNKTMEDGFLSGLVEKGRSFYVLKDYYQCNEVHRDDIVWFRISAPIPPVPRIVKALPGDKFEVVQTKDDPKQWNIKINGKWIDGESGRYFIKSEHIPPLKTYQISRKGKLRPGEFIVLSTTPPGLSDSGNLGLIRKRSLEGKVVLEAPNI